MNGAQTTAGPRSAQSGFALVTVMLLVALLMSLALAYFTLTHIEMTTTQAAMDSVRGFYAAEGGLNVRAGEIRRTFLGYARPSGSSPVDDLDTLCRPGNSGSGDFACQTYDLERRSVVTYVVEAPDNPTQMVVPRGEPYQNLSAQVYTYQVPAVAWGPTGRPEAVLEMDFQSRLIPLFQFAAFYNKDLEILPGPRMTLSGPVHTNGDLYLGSDDRLEIDGQVTLAGDLYRGRKDVDDCDGRVGVYDPTTLRWLPGCAAGRTKLVQSDLTRWNEMILTRQDALTVPEPGSLAPLPGKLYWDKADLRLVLDLDAGPPAFEIRNPDGGVDATRTQDLRDHCTAVTRTAALYNHRESASIELLDVDLEGLLDCIHDDGLLIDGRQLDDATHGGLVLYFTVEGPDSAALNNYGVRVYNGEEIRAGDALAPPVRGLTVVTDQAVYVRGHYNRTNKLPAAFLGDSLNLLSEGWDDANSLSALNARKAKDTEVNAAFLAGTDSTGGAEGPAGQNRNEYNGGLENYPRFHETWSGKTLRYRGSFVSLNQPLHVDGLWDPAHYRPPIRDWDYDTDFNNAARLPPLTPRVVYLKQDLFVRQFEL